MEHKDFLNLVSRRKLTVFIITAVILINLISLVLAEIVIWNTRIF